MRALSLLSRSRPSPLILRLPLRHVSTQPSPAPSSSFSSSSQTPFYAVTSSTCDLRRDDGASTSLLHWISGVVLGSGLGLLFWHSESDCGFPSVSLADWSTTPTAEHGVEDSPSSSLSRKFALPEYSPKFLFGGTRILIDSTLSLMCSVESIF